MKKIIDAGNCWRSFLGCMTDIPLSDLSPCSTEHDDWKEKTEETLAKIGLYFVELNPGLCSQLPHGALIGCHTNGISKPHILIGEVKRNGPRHGFVVYHDPSQRRRKGEPIEPQRIVLLCRLDK